MRTKYNQDTVVIIGQLKLCFETISSTEMEKNEQKMNRKHFKRTEI